jgi:D-alanyl-D-alanine carboxypeptidase
MNNERREFLTKICGMLIAAQFGTGIFRYEKVFAADEISGLTSERRRVLELMGILRPQALKSIPPNKHVAPNLGERDEQCLLPEATDAYIAMRDAARNDGIELVLDWSYRDYELQKRMWNIRARKWKNIRTVFRYISVPGTSFHHFGTEIDIRGPLEKPFNVRPRDFAGKGKFAGYFSWMKRNSAQYGFHLTYPNRKNPRGTGFEPWHYSFTELHRETLKEYLLNSDEIINTILSDKDISKINTVSHAFMKRYMRNYIEPLVITKHQDEETRKQGNAKKY